MWTKYTCPDGVEIQIEDCLAKCRMKCGRCVALPTLVMFAKGRREWKKKISTTQALNGTRMEFLKITKPFSEAPCSRAFALLGTFHHLRYQKLELPNALQEQWMEDAEGTGMFDYYDAETFEMYDFKTAGAYKVNRLLGKFSEEEEIPGEFFKSGPKRGLPKTRKVWALREPDNFEFRMQGSRYAWMLRDAGFRVDRYYVQVTVRDFNKMAARSYGLDRQIYLIEIPVFDRETVVAYYQAKQKALIEALEKNEIPPKCNDQETWDNRRCAEYCSVWSHCDHGRQIRAELIPNSEGEVDGQVA